MHVYTGAKRAEKERELAQVIAETGTDDPETPGLSERQAWVLSDHPVRLAQKVQPEIVEDLTEIDGVPLLWTLGVWTETTTTTVEVTLSGLYGRLPSSGSTSVAHFAFIDAWATDVEPLLGSTVWLRQRSTGESIKVELVGGSLEPVERHVVRVRYRDCVAPPVLPVRRIKREES